MEVLVDKNQALLDLNEKLAQIQNLLGYILENLELNIVIENLSIYGYDMKTKTKFVLSQIK